MRALYVLGLLTLPLLVGCPPSAPQLFDDLDEALLSVQATSPDDVWAFGSAAGGNGPLMLHWDGSAWNRIDTTALGEADLWWGHPTADTVFLAGSDGLVGEYDRASGTFTLAEGTDPAMTYFGVWGPSADDVWAVGGAIGASLPPSVRRWDGSSWSEWGEIADVTDTGDVYFKVDGTSADDVWLVGGRGRADHWDGTTLTDTGAAAVLEAGGENAPSLLTIDVGGEFPVAVGGAGTGVILRRENDTWVLDEPDFAPGMLGVCSGPDGAVRAVGGQGTVYDWDGSTWNQWERGITFAGLHGCWIDTDGGFWTVGGAISAEPLDQGVLLYQGGRTLGDIP